MAPTIVERDGKPALALGSPGGSTIIGTVLQTLVNRIDLREPLPNAIALPRAVERNTAHDPGRAGVHRLPEGRARRRLRPQVRAAGSDAAGSPARSAPPRRSSSGGGRLRSRPPSRVRRGGGQARRWCGREASRTRACSRPRPLRRRAVGRTLGQVSLLGSRRGTIVVEPVPGPAAAGAAPEEPPPAAPSRPRRSRRPPRP